MEIYGNNRRKTKILKNWNGDRKSYPFGTPPPTVLSKVALLSCARFTCVIYAKFFLLLLNNEDVQKLRSKLSGYMYVRYTLDTNPSTDGQR